MHACREKYTIWKGFTTVDFYIKYHDTMLGFDFALFFVHAQCETYLSDQANSR